MLKQYAAKSICVIRLQNAQLRYFGMMRLLSKLLNWRIFCIDAIWYNYDMYIPEHLTIEHAKDGVIVISNPYSFVYGIGITIEAAINDYQVKQDVYIEQQLRNSARLEELRKLDVHDAVMVLLERSMQENQDIWQRLADR